LDTESAAASTLPEIPALSARDYRRIRKGLLLEFWGLLYFPLLALFSPGTVAAGRYSGILIGTISTVLVVAGLSTLLTVCRDGLYQRYLSLAILGTGISWAEKMVATFTAIPRPLGAVLSALASLAALFFLLGLRRMITYTRWWEQILRRIRTDIVLVALFIVGPSVVGILESAGILGLGVLGWRVVLGVLFLVIAQIATLIHLWRTLQAIHQDAGLRNNILVIRGRRKNRPARGASSSSSLQDSPADPPVS
jgi:hypothetical protein